MSLSSFEVNALYRCKECKGLWWLIEVEPIGKSWTMRSAVGKCCDNSDDFESKLEFVRGGYDGKVLASAAGSLSKEGALSVAKLLGIARNSYYFLYEQCLSLMIDPFAEFGLWGETKAALGWIENPQDKDAYTGSFSERQRQYIFQGLGLLAEREDMLTDSLLLLFLSDVQWTPGYFSLWLQDMRRLTQTPLQPARKATV